MPVKWTLYSELAVRRLEGEDPTPIWDLETGRPLARLSRPDQGLAGVLLMGKTLYEPQPDGSWLSASGSRLPPLPEGHSLYRPAPDGRHALVKGPLRETQVQLDGQVFPGELVEAMGFGGLWLFRLDETGWTRLAGAPFGQEEESPAARWVPDHRAVQIEGAWAYRFRPEFCRLWFPATGRCFSTGPSGASQIADDLWVFESERGQLCVSGPDSSPRPLCARHLGELRQLAHAPGYFFTGGDQAWIWDLELKVRARLDTGLVWDLCAAGDRLLTRSERRATLWSVPQGKRLLDHPISDPDDTRFEPCIFSSHAGDWFLLSRFSMISPEIWSGRSTGRLWSNGASISRATFRGAPPRFGRTASCSSSPRTAPGISAPARNGSPAPGSRPGAAADGWSAPPPATTTQPKEKLPAASATCPACGSSCGAPSPWPLARGAGGDPGSCLETGELPGMNIQPIASSGAASRRPASTPSPAAAEASDPRDTVVSSGAPAETPRQAWGKRLVFGGLGLCALSALGPVLLGVGAAGLATTFALFGTGALTTLAGATLGENGQGNSGGDFNISNPAHPLNPANPINPSSPLNPNNF